MVATFQNRLMPVVEPFLPRGLTAGFFVQLPQRRLGRVGVIVGNFSAVSLRLRSMHFGNAEPGCADGGNPGISFNGVSMLEFIIGESYLVASYADGLFVGTFTGQIESALRFESCMSIGDGVAGPITDVEPRHVVDAERWTQTIPLRDYMNVDTAAHEIVRLAALKCVRIPRCDGIRD